MAKVNSHFGSLLTSVLLIVLAYGGVSVAAETALVPISEVVSRFTKSEKLMKFQDLDGAIAIIHGNQIVYKTVFGFKKSKPGKITEHTLFPLASVSKSVSSALVAYLVKQKKISFDDSVNEVIPGIDPKIKLKHILSHSSGYQDLFGNKAIESGQSREQLVRLFNGKLPEYPPGIHYSYSNVAFSFIENLISYRTHSSYEENVAKFLALIGIKDEEICDTVRLNQIAYPHRMGKVTLAFIPLPKYYPTTVCSSGGLYLSLDQMAKFVSFMLGHSPQILNAEDIQVLFEPQVEVTDIFSKWNMKWPYPLKELKSYYGLGWRILERNADKKNRLIFHSGHLNGLTTFVGLIPEKDLGIVILSNQDFVYSEPLGMDFWKYSAGVK